MEPVSDVVVTSSSTDDEKKKREPVKAQKKIKRPMTEERAAQLAAARAKKSQLAAERKRQQHKGNEEDMDESSSVESNSSRLVKGNGEGAQRYLEKLKENSSIEVTGTTPSKKRKHVPSHETNDVSLKSAAIAGLGLLGLAGIGYVAGKNLNPMAIKSGFTGHGSAIPGDPSKGIPAIPLDLSAPIPTRPGAAPQLGYFSQ